MAGKWISKSPMLDGSGIYRVNGVDYKIVRQDLITTTHTVAFIDGKEIARASNFPRLVRKLEAIQ